MKIIPVIFLQVIFVFVPLYADTPMMGKNLLPNESFENRPGFKDETPRGWGSWNSDHNGLSTTVRRKGQQSVYLVCPKQNDATGIFYTYKKVKPGNRYNFSGYVLNCAEDPIRGDAFGQLSIEWRKTTDKGQSEVSRDYGPKFGPEFRAMKWTFVTMSAVAPADADNCNFVIQFFNKQNGGGKFFTDDVSAEETSKSIAVKGFMLSKSRPRTKTGLLPERGTGAEKGGSQIESSLVAADFNSGSKSNDMGGDLGTWNVDPDDKCDMRFSSSVKHGDEGFSLQLDYNVGSRNPTMNGFWTNLQNQNISQYDKLSLWVKGDDSIGFSKNMKIELKNSKNENGKHTLSGIRKEWKRFMISLKDFAGLTDLSSMTKFVIRFDDEINADNKVGRIYVDDITFVK